MKGSVSAAAGSEARAQYPLSEKGQHMVGTFDGMMREHSVISLRQTAAEHENAKGGTRAS